MNLGATVATGLWLSGGLGATRRFHAALDHPAEAQEALLRKHLQRHASCEFGRRHDFASIRNAAEYAARVTLASYDDYAADIARVRQGDREVLACGPVTHLAPTSGSTGARKLIPFTTQLSAAFNAAVFPWMYDLVRQRPHVVTGPAYWSISPLADDGEQASAVPIGFADDAEYLGGTRAWLVRRGLAVPGSVRHVRDLDAFRGLTLLALLRCRDLRLLSIWHPSFLELLVDAAPAAWPALIEAIRSDENPWLASLPANEATGWTGTPDRERAAELHRIGPHDWAAWWPRLEVVSCWGDQAAEPGWRALKKRLPRVLVQPKGLLATEGVITIPLGSHFPLAVTSHYVEFLTDAGDVRGAHQLERDGRYEVVLTNGAGLWRYRLGDVVECTGLVRSTPSLRFLGRSGHVSDLRGEKLAEAFVAEVLGNLWPGEERPALAALRPREDGEAAGYELLVSLAADDARLADRLDAALSKNPHYALARRLGQLAPVRVVPLGEGAELEQIRGWRGRLGDAKPQVLLGSESDSDPKAFLTPRP